MKGKELIYTLLTIPIGICIGFGTVRGITGGTRTAITCFGIAIFALWVRQILGREILVAWFANALRSNKGTKP